MSASVGVLATPELMRLIFLEMPTIKLFSMQLVHKMYRQVIKESSALQKKMFLKADREPIK